MQKTFKGYTMLIFLSIITVILAGCDNNNYVDNHNAVSNSSHQNGEQLFWSVSRSSVKAIVFEDEIFPIMTPWTNSNGGNSCVEFSGWTTVNGVAKSVLQDINWLGLVFSFATAGQSTPTIIDIDPTPDFKWYDTHTQQLRGWRSTDTVKREARWSGVGLFADTLSAMASNFNYLYFHIYLQQRDYDRRAVIMVGDSPQARQPGRGSLSSALNLFPAIDLWHWLSGSRTELFVNSDVFLRTNHPYLPFEEGRRYDVYASWSRYWGIPGRGTLAKYLDFFDENTVMYTQRFFDDDMLILVNDENNERLDLRRYGTIFANVSDIWMPLNKALASHDMALVSILNDDFSLTVEESSNDLNLPITMRSTTSGFDIRITPEGLLQRYIFEFEHGQRQPGEWKTIATNVRTFAGDLHNFFRNGSGGYSAATLFFIKQDNTLWGLGSNLRGRLGDNTGLDRSEPVFILENVAYIALSPHGRKYGLQTDGTLMRWGNGIYAPVHVADNVVRVFFSETSGLDTFIHRSNGGVYRFAYRESGVTRLISEPVYYISDTLFYYINSERSLIQTFDSYNALALFLQNFAGSVLPTQNAQEIAHNVDRLHVYGSVLFVTHDRVLWGMGGNHFGELGDATRTPRSEPVRIAENVMDLIEYAFLKQDGTLWAWDINNPTPRKELENVKVLVNGGGARRVQSPGVHLNNNRFAGFILHGSSFRIYRESFDVRIPRYYIFN
ncbi:MAG: hypothetical protein FWC91_10010 [Defluviitaleaceae bacterium]|nr:hypothetical protein [Defluviitaleaceae bacterium]